MMRRVTIVRVVVAAVTILIISALVLRIVDSEIDNRNRAKENSSSESVFSGILAEYNGESVCEVIVEMGRVKTSSLVVETIRIVNNTTTPLMLLDYSTQCRCMWLDFQREAIQPGETLDVELSFDSRGEWGTVGNYMEITTTNKDFPIVMWIGAEIE